MRRWIRIRYWGVVNALLNYRKYRREGFGPIEAWTSAYAMGKMKFSLVRFLRECQGNVVG